MGTNSQDKEINETYSRAKKRVVRNALLGVGVSLIPIIYGLGINPNLDASASFLYPSNFISDYVQLPEVKRYGGLEKDISVVEILKTQLKNNSSYGLKRISNAIEDDYLEKSVEISQLSKSEPVESYLIAKRNNFNATLLLLSLGIIGISSSMFYFFRKSQSLDKKRDDELAKNSFMWSEGSR